MFDGYTRSDVTMSDVCQRKVTAKGYSGPVAMCAARYVPIAGNRPNRQVRKFMTENKVIEVRLALVGATNVLMPFRISMRATIGAAVAEASEFSIADK